MTSPAQIAANRRNAAKSSGPKTAAGKAVVARNALRHGLTTRQVVVPGEGLADFVRFHAEIRGVLNPTDAIEEELVERIVICAWRLRRMGCIEAALLADASGHVGSSAVYGTELGVGFSRVLPAMTTLSRYESVLDRALRQAQMLLERHQARRRGEDVAPPLAVAVAGFELTDGGAEKVKICETNPISESMAVATVK